MYINICIHGYEIHCLNTFINPVLEYDKIIYRNIYIDISAFENASVKFVSLSLRYIEKIEVTTSPRIVKYKILKVLVYYLIAILGFCFFKNSVARRSPSLDSRI